MQPALIEDSMTRTVRGMTTMWKSWRAKVAGGCVRIGQRNIAWILSLVALLTIPAAQLHAVIISGTDAATLNAPSDDPGWSNVGTTANGLGCEYIGNGWVLTAAHCRSADSSETATFNGVTYNLVGTSIRLHAPGSSDPIDLSLYQVADQYGHTPGLNSLPISSATPANQETVMGMGFGVDRASSPTYWNYGNPTWVQVQHPPAQFTGYFWAGNNPKRWGLNQVSGVSTLINAGWGDNYAIKTIFDQSGGTDEFQVSSGDSGGALFYKTAAGGWTLAGVLEAMGTYTNQPASTAVYGDSSYAVDLSYYRDQITAAVQVFQFSGTAINPVMNNPNATIGTGWQNSQLIGNGGFGNLTGNCSIPVDFNGHQFTFQSGANNITYTGTLFGAGDLIVQGGDPNSYSITLSGASANTYTGATQVQSGLLVLDKTAGAAALSGSQITVYSGAILRTDTAQQISASTAMYLQGGVFNLNGQAQTIGSLSGTSGNIQLGSGILTVNQTAAGTFSGQISGTGNFTKSGTADLILNGNNIYTGLTTVASGVLQLANTSALGTTAGGTIVQNGGALDLNGLNIGNEPLTISGTGSGGIGALVNRNTSATAVFNGPLTLGGDASAGGSGNMTLSGPISGVGSFTKTGSGTLILTNNESFTGDTIINAGVLALNTTGQIENSAIVNDATLQFLAGDHSVASISGNGDTVVLAGTLTTDSIFQNTFTLAPGTRVTIRAIPGGPQGSRLTPVPEPSTWILMVIGVLCLLCRCKRK